MQCRRETKQEITSIVDSNSELPVAHFIVRVPREGSIWRSSRSPQPGFQNLLAIVEVVEYRRGLNCDDKIEIHQLGWVCSEMTKRRNCSKLNFEVRKNDNMINHQSNYLGLERRRYWHNCVLWNVCWNNVGEEINSDMSRQLSRIEWNCDTKSGEIFQN